MAKKPSIPQRIGKAAFDRTRRGMHTAAARPKPKAEEKPMSRAQKFDQAVTREMRSGATRASAIDKAMRARAEKL